MEWFARSRRRVPVLPVDHGRLFATVVKIAVGQIGSEAANYGPDIYGNSSKIRRSKYKCL